MAGMRKGVVRSFWGAYAVLVLSSACSGKTENAGSRGDDGGSSGAPVGGSAGASSGGTTGSGGSDGSDGSGGAAVAGAGGAGASAGAAGSAGPGGAAGIAGAAGSAGVDGGGAAGVAGFGQGGIGGSMPDSSLVGTWVGDVENHQFGSGSDEVRVVITDGAPSGYVVFGNGTAAPPPNPETGYPPSSGGGAAGRGGSARYEVYEGFQYTVFAGNVTGDRVRFKVESHELWQEWCSLQTPVPSQDGSGGYNCMPNLGYSSDGTHCWQADREVDCGKIELCFSQVCACTAQSCQATGQGDTVFDLDHKGSELDGSVNGVFGLHNVRLTQE